VDYAALLQDLTRFDNFSVDTGERGKDRGLKNCER